MEIIQSQFYGIPSLIDAYSTRMTDEVGKSMSEYDKKEKKKRRKNK